MKPLLFITISLLILGQSLHAQVRYWKHTAKQGDVWSCHAFCATGLVEAAYKKETGKYIDLSEADLMLKHFKGKHKSWDPALRDYLLQAYKTDNPRSLETGNIEYSFAIIKKHGVATEKEMPYDPLFRIDFPMSTKVLRHQFTAFQKKINEFKHNRQELNNSIPDYIRVIRKNGLQKNLEKEEQFLKSRSHIRSFIAPYRLKKIFGKMNRASLIKLVQNQPIAVAYNVRAKNGNRRHLSHVVIFERYDTQKQTFIIRNSDAKHFFTAKQTSIDSIIAAINTVYILQK